MRRRGFSLLEVLVALAILAVGLLAVMRILDNGVLISQYENQQITAATLARWKIVEVKLQLEKDGFPADDKEDCGKFDEDHDLDGDGFTDYSWCYDIKKVNLPLPMDMLGGGQNGQNGQGGAATSGAPTGDASGAAAGAGNAGSMASMLGVDPKAAGDALSKAVRSLTVTVKWTFHGKEQQLPVTTHLVSMSSVEL